VVMRQAVGDDVLLFNGADGEWRARVGEVSKRGCVLVCEERTRAQGAGQQEGQERARYKRQVACHNERAGGVAGVVQRGLDAAERPARGGQIGDAPQAGPIVGPGVGAGIGGRAADQDDVVDEAGEGLDLSIADGAAADQQAALVRTVQPRGAAAGQDRRRAGASGEGRRRHVGSERGRAANPAGRRRSARYVTRK